MSRSMSLSVRRFVATFTTTGVLALGTLAVVATAAAEPPPVQGESVTEISVKNPLGMALNGTKVTNPNANTPEATILATLNSQATGGSFQAFLGFIHSAKKSEPLQRANLEAYQYKASQGAVSDKCRQDGGTALITVSRKDVHATIAGGGDTGVKVMVWCGDDRMPVPISLYPEGDSWKVTVWGLN